MISRTRCQGERELWEGEQGSSHLWRTSVLCQSCWDPKQRRQPERCARCWKCATVAGSEGAISRERNTFPAALRPTGQMFSETSSDILHLPLWFISSFPLETCPTYNSRPSRGLSLITGIPTINPSLQTKNKKRLVVDPPLLAEKLKGKPHPQTSNG